MKENAPAVFISATERNNIDALRKTVVEQLLHIKGISVDNDFEIPFE